MDQDFTVCHPALTRPQVELSDDNSAKRVSPRSVPTERQSGAYRGHDISDAIAP